jgi:parallel beta-helix repeat protein
MSKADDQSSEARFRRASVIHTVLWAVVACLLGGATLAQTPGPNRNVVSGVVDPLAPADSDEYARAVVRTDLLRQRQNEPAMVPSSTNPEHLIAAANDYRTIDFVEEDDTIGERTDSLIFRALTRVVSLLKSFLGIEGPPPTPVAAPPRPDAWMGVYRSCNRGSAWYGSLLPGSWTDTSPASLASPLRGLQTASDPVLAAAPDGRAYLGGLAFTRGGASAIFAARYTDRNDREGGACFAYDFTRVVEAGSASETGRFADKPTVAADVTRPKGGNAWRYVYMAYTIFTGLETDANFRGRVRFVRSSDDGETWSKPVTVSGSYIHNQGASLAIDPSNGDLYLVWRDFTDHQILMARSHDFGARWSDPAPIADGFIHPFDQPTGLDQFRSNGFPTIAIDGNHQIFVAWQELVNADGEPDPNGTTHIVLTKSESITNQGVTWSPRRAVDPDGGPQVMPALSAHAGQLMLLYAEGVDGALAGRDIRLDMKVVEIDPSTGTRFDDRPPVQVSEYDLQYEQPGGTEPEDNEPYEVSPGYPAYHRPNLPMFRKGEVPFVGDYQWLTPSRPFVRTKSGEWKWASDVEDVRNPSFHAIWTDNRNVRFPGDSLDGDWKAYAPPGTGQPSCLNAGSRDQDVYTSEISSGIVAGSPSLFKPLLRRNEEGELEPIQRAFVAYVENRTPDPHVVRLELVPEDIGGVTTIASFDQFDPDQVTLPPAADGNWMQVLPYATLTRTVYIESTVEDATATFEVWVPSEVPGGSDRLLARVVLNEKRSDLPLTNSSIADSETHTPRISNPRISNPRISNPRISNPRISNWLVSNPRISNPRISNPRISNDLVEGWETRDVTYTMVNTGNTTTVYDLQTYIPDEFLAEGSPYQFQLIVYRTVSSPESDMVSGLCEPVEVLYDELISNVESPRISNPRISNTGTQSPRISNPRISNAAFYLEPAEGPVGAYTGGDATQSLVSAATPSIESAETRTSSLGGLNAAVATLAADTDSVYAGVPIPQVRWTLRIYQTRPVVGEEPPIWELAPAPTDPPGDPLVSAAVVSQPTNVIDGVVQEDPPFVLVGPEPPVPEKEVDGELVPMENVSTSPSALAFSRQPRSTQAGQTMTPPVEVRLVDASGATVPVSGTEVTLTLPANPGALSGISTRLSDSGFATFDDLVIRTEGEGYTLQAASPGLASATSTSFDVTIDTPFVPPITTRVSVESSGGEGFGPGEGCSGGRSITPDGRFVAFDCTFTNLVVGDSNGARDVFVHDRWSGTTTRVSVANDGTEADGDSTFASLSDDGRFVAFQSLATNLDTAAPDTNWVSDVFIHDRDPDGDGIYDEAGDVRTTRVSVGLTEADGPSTLPVISGDGQTVAFWSEATNLVPDDTNGEPDVFVFDGDSLAISRVSVKTGGEQANSAEGLALPAAPALSRNGRVVAFQSTRADLAAQGKVGWRDIYVHDRNTATTTRVSVASDGTEGTIPKGCGPWDGPEGKLACSDFASSNPSLSADGRFVAFDSIYDNLVPGDTNFDGTYLGRDVFVHDRQTGETTRLSISTDGIQDNTYSPSGAACGVGPHAPAMSPDGRFVTFSSCGSSLVAGDTNQISDAFLRDRFLGTTVRVSTYSGGAQVTTFTGAFGTRFAAASRGARFLAMGSDVETMVDGDTNRNVATGELGGDVFVAEPIPASAPPAERFLVFTVEPSDTPAREPITPAIQVEIQDASGNTDLTASDLVTLSVESGIGRLLGTTTVNAISGVAVFPGVSLSEEGLHTLRANAVGLSGVVSSQFTAQPPAIQLGFVVHPASTEAGATIPAVQVAVQDRNGVRVSTRTDEVTLTLQGEGLGVLSGSVSVAAVNGIAAFNDLSVDVVADDYALEARAVDLTVGISDEFDVVGSSAPVAFVVTNTNGSGPGSLHQAVIAANANLGQRDEISFAIPGAPPHRIIASLPSILDAVVVDATTQDGYYDAPIIELYGNGAGAVGLQLYAGNSVVTGLAISGFAAGALEVSGGEGNTLEANYLGLNSTGTPALGSGPGLRIVGSGANQILNNVISGNTAGIEIVDSGANTMQGNFIGTSDSGEAAISNQGSGVILSGGGTTANTLRGNVVSGNTEYGIRIDPSPGLNLIVDNRIGTDAAGALSCDNGYGGIAISNSPGNVIGRPGEGNLISGNTGSTGVFIEGTASTATIIEGNRIGTNAAGDAAVGPQSIGIHLDHGPSDTIIRGNVISGNGLHGVFIHEGARNELLANKIGTNAAGTAAVGNAGSGVEARDADSTIVGRLDEGNIISGNGVTGVSIVSSLGNDRLQANKIGTDVTGTIVLANVQHGLRLSAAGGTIVGGWNPGEGNVISGNGGDGIYMEGATSVFVAGNLIGTNDAGAELGNGGNGVTMSGSSSTNSIGGLGSEDGNVIAFNSGYGIVDAPGITGTHILGNSIFANGLLGIFSNGRVNPPLLSSAYTSGEITTVSGSLSQYDSPNSSFRIEFFWSTTCDASDHGEGERFLGRMELTTDGSRDADFDVPLNAISGGVLTATATTSALGTSGFSICLVPDISTVIGEVRTIISAEAAYQSAAFGWYGYIFCLATPTECIADYPANSPIFLSEGLASLETRLGYARAFSPGPEVPHWGLLVPGLENYAYTAAPESGYGPGFCGESTGLLLRYDDGVPIAVDGQCVGGTILQ